MAFYKNSVLMLVGGLVIILSCIELVLVVCLRLLQTAVTSSVESDDPEGPSYGYFFQDPQTTKGGLDTTIESTETDTLLDTTADTTISKDVDEFDEERYVEMEPLYENIGPIADGDEHIYHDGDVEDYLAGKFARSREKFEHFSEPGYEEIPAYMAPPVPPAPPPPPISNVNHNRSPTSLHKVQSNYGSYMAMNISNSSWAKSWPMIEDKVPKRHRKHHKVRVKRHHSPSPTFLSNSTKDTFVINMDQNRSPPRFRSYFEHKHRDPERRRLLHSNPNKMLHISPNRGAPLYKSTRFPIEPRCSYKHSATNLSPIRTSPNRQTRCVSSDIFSSIYGKKKSPLKKSPSRRISPQKTTFKSGVSYKCNHAFD